MIKVIDFHKAFGLKKVHKGVSFEVRKGECLGLIGGWGWQERNFEEPHWAGKTRPGSN